MAILNSFMQPTVGIPQPASFNMPMGMQPSSMNNPSFYGGQQFGTQSASSPILTEQLQTQRPQYDQQPVTQDYLTQQFDRLRNRPAVPQLNPASRVMNPNMALVQPSSFQQYYDALNSIGQAGQQAVATEQAGANARHQQEMLKILSQKPPPFTGVTLQGNYSDQPGIVSGGSGGPTEGGISPHSGMPIGNLPAYSDNAYNQRVVQRMAAERGWTGPEWNALNQIMMKESGYNSRAANPNSDARGLFQKMINIHGPIESTPEGQTQWGLDYIARRYGTPSNALQWHLAHNWY